MAIRLNWSHIESVIRENHTLYRKTLAGMCGCHYSTQLFQKLCLRYGVPNIKGQRPGSHHPTKGYKMHRGSVTWGLYDAICPYCRCTHQVRSERPLRGAEKYLFCPVHEHHREIREMEGEILFGSEVRW